MKYVLSKESIAAIEEILNKGSRAEVLVEKTKIVIVEIKRKIKKKE